MIIYLCEDLQGDHQGVLGRAEQVHGGDQPVVKDYYKSEYKERSILNKTKSTS